MPGKQVGGGFTHLHHVSLFGLIIRFLFFNLVEIRHIWNRRNIVLEEFKKISLRDLESTEGRRNDEHIMKKESEVGLGDRRLYRLYTVRQLM